MSSGYDIRRIIRVRRRNDIPYVSADELDKALLCGSGNASYIIQADNDDGMSFLKFATCVFSRLVVIRRPCLDVIVPRAVADPKHNSSQKALGSDNNSVGSQEAVENWLSVAADDHKFGDGSTVLYDKYNIVAVGGTFDRLHAGHRLLLTAACWAARQKLLIGVTAECLLLRKQYKDLIVSFEERSRAAKSYAQRVKPSLQHVDVVELKTPEGPTTSDPGIDALVVSEETAKGAEKINEVRTSAGLKPLTVIVVDVLDTVEQKLSSSALRKAEYDRARLAEFDGP